MKQIIAIICLLLLTLTSPLLVFSSDHEDENEDNEDYEEFKPEPSDKWPYGDEWYDEREIDYIELTFDDNSFDLEFTGLEAIRGVQVIPETVGTNRLDIELLNDPDQLDDKDFDIFERNWFREEAYLRVPVTGLQPNSTYEVKIPTGVIENTAYDIVNKEMDWTFTTMPYPRATTQDLSPRNISEDYSRWDPILIYGDKIYEDDVQVYFNDKPANFVDYIDIDDGDDFLEVYLPYEDPLEPGLYDITIANSENHKTHLYGALSILGGDYDTPPKEGIGASKQVRFGSVKDNLSRSEQVLAIDDQHSKHSSVSINLDEFMRPRTRRSVVSWTAQTNTDNGIHVMDLVLEGNRYSISGINADNEEEQEEEEEEEEEEQDDQELIIEKVGSFRESYLKRRLHGYNIKSDFMEISSENLNVEHIYLEIPVEGYEDEDLVVLRFDEVTRDWSKTAIFDIDSRGNVVKAVGQDFGTYVVVERRQ